MNLDNPFWTGVVEDRKDPLKLGRCRVRILGVHPESKKTVPTSDLPWAYPLQSISSAAINGIGQTPLGPVEGTWVVGFFRDGSNCQDAVILGTLGGIPGTKPDKNKGFNDPNGIYPKFIEEPDTNRLARNENLDKTSLKKKKDERQKDIETANGIKWSEPENPYKAEYPFNHVKETESGHILEFDDTKSHERINLEHKSGSFLEFHPNGDLVQKIQRDKFEVIVGNNHVLIKGNCNITIDGDSNLLVKKNANVQVNGNSIVKIKGDSSHVVDGESVYEVNKNLKIKTKGNISYDSTGQINITSKKRIKLKAPRIDLN